MTIALRDFDALDPDAVAANLTEVTERIVEDNPTLDLRPGVLFSILAYYHALLETQHQAEVADYLAARSLLDLEADPALADPDAVDAVLSNYRIERKPGSAATGTVAIVLSAAVTVTIGVGAEFQARGRRYRADRTYVAKAEPEQIHDEGDRLLVPAGDGKYRFTIGVVAADDGPDAALRKDTTLIPAVLPTAFVTAYAASDFAGGVAAETNAELLDRLQAGVAARCLADRASMRALLRDQDAFARATPSSIIGYGDPELVRGDRSIFPIRVGSRCDWYVRTQGPLLRLGLTRAATLLGYDDDGAGIWQLTLGRDDAPGFYEAAAIRPAGTDPAGLAGGLEVTADVRGVDLSGPGFVPDVATATEGAYTRFQTAVVRFRDPATPGGLAAGARADYDLEARGLPLIGAIQDFVSGRDVRHHGADCLVKAPVPCFVQLSLTVLRPAGSPDPDAAAIAAALAGAVNAVGFAGRLAASQLQAVVFGFLDPGTTVSAIAMLGRIRTPAGDTVWLRSDEALTVPDDPDGMVTARTVQFFADAEDIAVGVAVAAAADT